MKKDGRLTAFYMEMLLLGLIFTLMVMVLVRVFALGSLESRRAAELNTAVSLAENAAEAVSASSSKGELEALLNEAGNAGQTVQNGGTGVLALYDRNGRPDPAGVMEVLVSWTPEKTPGGTLVHSDISVRGADHQEIYFLQTAVFLEEARL